MSNSPVQQAPARAPIVTPGGLVSREWLMWCNAVQQATADISTQSTANSTNAAQLNSLAAQLASLAAQFAQVGSLTAGNQFSGTQLFESLVTFALAPTFLDQPGTRAALGLGSAATMPASAFEAAATASNALQKLNNLSDVGSVTAARTNLQIPNAILVNKIGVSDDYGVSVNLAKSITVNGS